MMALREAVARGGVAVRRYGGRAPDAGREMGVRWTALTAAMNRLPGDRGFRTEEYRPFPNMVGRNWKQRRLEIPAMIRALRLPRGKRVLEVGCGRGCALTVLGKLLEPARLVGLDIDEEFLAAAERSLGEANVSAELLHGDVRDMPLPSNSFELVIDFGTCYHIAFAARALDEIHRVLTPGGQFVHETRLSQLLSHPFRSLGRSMPLHAAPQLEPDRWRMLWAARTKSSSAAGRWGS